MIQSVVVGRGRAAGRVRDGMGAGAGASSSSRGAAAVLPRVVLRAALRLLRPRFQEARGVGREPLLEAAIGPAATTPYFLHRRSRARCWPQPTSERHPVEEQGTAAAWFEVRTRSGRGSSAARRAVPASERPGRAGAQRAGCGLRPRGARRPCYRESCVELVVCACSDQDSKRLAVSAGVAARGGHWSSSDHAILSAPEFSFTLLGAAHERAASRRGTGDCRPWFQVRPRSGRGSSAARRAVPASERSGRAGARSRPSSSWGACAPGRHERLLPQDPCLDERPGPRPSQRLRAGAKCEKTEFVLLVLQPAA